MSMKAAKGGPLIQLKIQDFDPNYKLEALPEDFECQICMMVKEDMLECPKCVQGACRDCLADFTTRSKKGNVTQNKFECSVCHHVGVFYPPNKILADLFQHLKFQCPDDCRQIYPYRELAKHKQKGLCYQGYKRPDDQAQPRVKYGAKSAMPAASANMDINPPVSMAESMFGGKAAYKDPRPPCTMVHLLQKDSRVIFQMDFLNLSCKQMKVKNQHQFPHNFQCVNGPAGQLYLVGGGDYQKDEETLYSLFEIQTNNGYNFVKRDSMKHPRHGHSAVWFSDKFIVVTGSRKEKNNSQVKAEMYNTDIDLWFEMPDLNVGRHYHSSCTFFDKQIYVFCGIANHTRKYINSIERYDHVGKKAWTLIEVNSRLFPDRQGCGVVQRDNKDIVIFGGFSGKFLRDSYLLDTNTQQLTKTMQMPNECFLFQMPAVYDSSTSSVFCCDLQRHLVYMFNDQAEWKIYMQIKE